MHFYVATFTHIHWHSSISAAGNHVCPLKCFPLLSAIYSSLEDDSLRGQIIEGATNTPAAAKSLQSCPTLYNRRDGSPPGCPVPEILQARTLEWVPISFSNAWKGKGKVKSLSRVRLFVIPWTAAHWAPPSMGFSRQEYWSGVPLPSPTNPSR